MKKAAPAAQKSTACSSERSYADQAAPGRHDAANAASAAGVGSSERLTCGDELRALGLEPKTYGLKGR